MAVATLDDLTEAAAKLFAVEASEITGPRRYDRFVRPRQAVYHTGFSALGLPPTVIAQYFGRDHSTIGFGIKAARCRATREVDYHRKLDALRMVAIGREPQCPNARQLLHEPSARERLVAAATALALARGGRVDLNAYVADLHVASVAVPDLTEQDPASDLLPAIRALTSRDTASDEMAFTTARYGLQSALTVYWARIGGAR